CAARSADVLDIELVAERFGKFLRAEARDDVGRTARRIGHDDADVSAGIGLSVTCACEHKRCETCDSSKGAHHVLPLLVFAGLRSFCSIVRVGSSADAGGTYARIPWSRGGAPWLPTWLLSRVPTSYSISRRPMWTSISTRATNHCAAPLRVTAARATPPRFPPSASIGAALTCSSSGARPTRTHRS